jgi:histone H2A
MRGKFFLLEISLIFFLVAISSAVNIPFSFVIHANSGSWNTTDAITKLESVVKNVLSLCDEKNLTSVAFPSIGSGRAGYPKQLAAETILRTINSYFASTMQSSIKQVYFVLFDDESVEVYRTELARLV